MKQFEYIITEAVGIHARPASILVKASEQYKSSITIKRGDKSADVKRLLGLMALGVKFGETVTFLIDGADEEAAAVELEAFCIQNL